MSRLSAVVTAGVVALVLAAGAPATPPRPSVTSAAAAPSDGRPLTLPLPSGNTGKPAPRPSAPTEVDCEAVKCIALTFDDGPVRQTPAVLDALRARGARATFFVLGNMARQHPAVLRRMLAEGDAIGNHSWDHPQFFSMSSAAVSGQIRRTNAAIRAATGRTPTLMRPPFGEQDARIRRVIRGFGDPVVLWNVDTLDWKYRDTKRLVAYVKAHARRNAIVLMHDIRPTTRAAVPAIVDELQARGYALVTVPELLKGRLRPGRVYTSG